jgi:signal transduction histidine kinase
MNSPRTKDLAEHVPLLVSERDLGSGLRSDREHVECDRSTQCSTACELDDKERSATVENLFAARIAHDLNNVLSTICCYGVLAQRQLGAVETNRYIDNVVKASSRARALTQQLFAIDGGEPGPETPVCIQGIVEEVLEWIAITLPGGVRLQTTLWAGKTYVLADSTQLYRIVMNLCTNAVRAMGRGGVLAVVLDEVVVPVAQVTTHGSLVSGVYVRLSVSDTGAGISPRVLEQIFDPFFTTKSAARDSGLGLAIVRNIVHALGGAIDVRTDVGVGTTFAVWLRSRGAGTSCDGQSAPLDVGTGSLMTTANYSAALSQPTVAPRSWLGSGIAATKSSQTHVAPKPPARPMAGPKT